MKSFEEQDIIEKLRTRAQIRRKIDRGEGQRDRIAETCEEAANLIESLRALVIKLENEISARDKQ